MTTITKGSRLATINRLHGRWTVYVGYAADKACPGEETVPAHWFKGLRTCSATFATEKTALKKAHEFLNH